MSTFTMNSITVQGLNVIAKLVAGSTLEFTRIAIGDGAMPSDKTPLTVTDLSHRLFDVTINSVTSNGNGSATVTGVFSNADKETGFFYRELGLFAKDPDTQKEFLYCYGNAAADAEWISPSGASSVIEKEVKIVTLVGNAEKVTANIPSGIYATKEEMQTALSVKADLDATADAGGRVLAKQMRFDPDQTLYVDAAAAEGGDGSEDKPFKTIQSAINARYRGAAVIYIKIKAGTYNEDISIPRSPDTTWRIIRDGSGIVSVNSAVIDNCAYILLDNLTFDGPAPSNSTFVYVANTPCANFNAVTISGTSAATGVNFSTSRGIIRNSVFNNCGIAIAATDGGVLDLKGNSGTGNTRALHADGGSIICDWYVPEATTPYETANGGMISVQGGASSFPSNYSQRLNLGDFTDLAALKSAILAEMVRLGIGESRACWFANNIPSGFGIFGTGQRMICDIIKTTDYNGGFGIVIFYSHNYSACGFMRIQNGAFTSDSPIAFFTQEGGTFTGQISTNGGQNFPSINQESGAELWLFRKNDPIYKGGFILRAISPDGNAVTTNLEGKYGSTLKWGGREIVRSVNNNLADDLGNVTIPNASATEYGLVKMASEQDELNPKAAGAALAPANVYKLCNFRLINHAYSEGDIVACAYHADLQLKCTQAGTTSGDTLDTSGAEEGQEITDGTVKWTVESLIDKNYVDGALKNATLVGDIAFRPYLAEGWVKANGATVKRADYPALVEFATKNGLWAGTNAYAAEISVPVYPWQFGPGDGSTTMVLPDYRNRFIEGGDAVGVKSAGLPNITGNVQWAYQGYSNSNKSNGALFIDTSIPGENAPTTGGTNNYNGQTNPVAIDASRSSSIYGASDTVQPPAIVLIPQIKY